jgi:hypothetical protein
MEAVSGDPIELARQAANDAIAEANDRKSAARIIAETALIAALNEAKGDPAKIAAAEAQYEAAMAAARQQQKDAIRAAAAELDAVIATVR